MALCWGDVGNIAERAQRAEGNSCSHSKFEDALNWKGQQFKRIIKRRIKSKQKYVFLSRLGCAEKKFQTDNGEKKNAMSLSAFIWEHLYDLLFLPVCCDKHFHLHTKTTGHRILTWHFFSSAKGNLFSHSHWTGAFPWYENRRVERKKKRKKKQWDTVPQSYVWNLPWEEQRDQRRKFILNSIYPPFTTVSSPILFPMLWLCLKGCKQIAHSGTHISLQYARWEQCVCVTVCA